MGHWVERITEPHKLYLAWQAPDHMGDRFRWAVGVLERRERGVVLRYLREGDEFRSLNVGKPYDQLSELGYKGYPAFNLKQELHADGVMAPLMRRLPPRRRSDFTDYKRQFRLAEHLDLTDFALLGRTEAKLPSDGFSVVDPLESEGNWCDLFLEIAGFRYYCDKLPLALNIGKRCDFKHEPTNPYDPSAVEITSNGCRLGYVNRLQAATFLRWLRGCKIEAVVERLGCSINKPRAFVFVRVRPAASCVAA